MSETATRGRTTGETGAAPKTDPESGWELVRQLRRWKRIVIRSVTILVLLGALVVLSEAFRFYELFARVHWLVGTAYIGVVLALLAFFVGWPIWRFAWLPGAMKPPDVDLGKEHLTLDQLRRRARFVVQYSKSLERNPELSDDRARVRKTTLDATSLCRTIHSAGTDQVPELSVRLQQFETKQVDPLLKQLDARVDAYIRREAISVGIGTAVSLNGTIDAFIVLWRNANMVSRIGRYYYGRPTLRGSLLIIRDVAGAIVLSRALDDLSDMAGGLVGKMLGSVSGLVAGPVVDGTVNALMTMKVGYLAKRRCRSFQAWTPGTVRGVLVEVVGRVTAESSGVIAELLGQLGGAGIRAATAAKDVVVAGASAVASGGRTAWHLVSEIFGGEAQAGSGAS